MKILFLSDLLSYGGASKLLFDLLPRITEQGNQCELLILTDKNSKYVDELRNKGIPVNVVPQSIHGHIGKILYIKKYIQNGQYDIIHANLFPTTYYCSIAKRLLGKQCPPLFMTEHSTDNKRRHIPLLRPLEKYIYKGYDHVISISGKTQEKLCEWLEIRNMTKFSVIENGIDVDGFRNAQPFPKKEIFPMYKDGDILLLTVGSFTPQKNHKNLIEALSLLPSNYKLILCGEGPLEADIKDQVEKYGLAERVSFLGFRKDIARIIHSVDILVIPSLWEGFGLIAAEGMACGAAIAAADVPGLSEVVGESGKKFNPNQASSIAEAIEYFEQKDKREFYAKKGIERSSKYDISNMTKKYMKLYKMIK